MLNTVTEHGACSIIFGVCGFIVCLVFCLPRTLVKVSYIAIPSFISIFSAVMITMIGVGIQKPGDQSVDVAVKSNLANGFLAATNIVFAFSGHVAFFGFISELRNPEEYPKALYLLQGVDTCMYLIVAIVTYRYAGDTVTSPALGSTGPTLQKVAYGVAIPTIVGAGVINGHVAAKYMYVRLFRNTDKMSKRSWSSFGWWALIVVSLWILAWIIAEAIPVFNDLLGLISALFATWFTYGLSGLFWLYMNKGRYTESRRKMFLTGLNIFVFCVGAAIVSLMLSPPFLNILTCRPC